LAQAILAQAFFGSISIRSDLSFYPHSQPTLMKQLALRLVSVVLICVATYIFSGPAAHSDDKRENAETRSVMMFARRLSASKTNMTTTTTMMLQASSKANMAIGGMAVAGNSTIQHGATMQSGKDYWIPYSRYKRMSDLAIAGHGCGGKCKDRLYYSSLRQCRDRCSECNDCKGFVNTRVGYYRYCAFKSIHVTPSPPNRRSGKDYWKRTRFWKVKPNMAIRGHGCGGKCKDRLYYSSRDRIAVECGGRCNDCNDCIGFIDNKGPKYCVFKSKDSPYHYRPSGKDYYKRAETTISAPTSTRNPGHIREPAAMVTTPVPPGNGDEGSKDDKGDQVP